MDAYQTAFGNHDRGLRIELGATQEELAHRAGCHVTYLSGVERGIRNASLKTFEPARTALGIGVAKLFAFETELHRTRENNGPKLTESLQSDRTSHQGFHCFPATHASPACLGGRKSGGG